MPLTDIEVNLTDEAQAIRDTAHKFAEEVMRPAGAELDRLPTPPTSAPRARCSGTSSRSTASSASTPSSRGRSPSWAPPRPRACAAW